MDLPGDFTEQTAVRFSVEPTQPTKKQPLVSRPTTVVSCGEFANQGSQCPILNFNPGARERIHFKAVCVVSSEWRNQHWSGGAHTGFGEFQPTDCTFCTSTGFVQDSSANHSTVKKYATPKYKFKFWTQCCERKSVNFVPLKYSHFLFRLSSKYERKFREGQSTSANFGTHPEYERKFDRCRTALFNATSVVSNRTASCNRKQQKPVSSA